MFRGLYEHTIDEKGRISLPARFREILVAHNEQKVVLTTHYSEGCLVAYPISEWQQLEARVMEKPQHDRRVTRFKRLFIAPAIDCALDKHGRLIVPGVHRQHAALERDVMWVGMINYLELWDRDAWHAMRELERKYTRENEDDFDQDLSELGI